MWTMCMSLSQNNQKKKTSRVTYPTHSQGTQIGPSRSHNRCECAKNSPTSTRVKKLYALYSWWSIWFDIFLVLHWWQPSITSIHTSAVSFHLINPTRFITKRKATFVRVYVNPENQLNTAFRSAANASLTKNQQPKNSLLSHNQFKHFLFWVTARSKKLVKNRQVSPYIPPRSPKYPTQFQC